VVVVDCLHQYHKLRISLLQQPRAADPAHPGQTDVYQRHVRQVGPDLVERVFHRSKTANAAESFRPADQRDKIIAELAVVFDDRHLQRGAGGRRGGADFSFASHSRLRSQREAVGHWILGIGYWKAGKKAFSPAMTMDNTNKMRDGAL